MKPSWHIPIMAALAIACCGGAEAEEPKPTAPAKPATSSPDLDELLGLPSGKKKEPQPPPAKVEEPAAGSAFESAVDAMEQAADRLQTHADPGLETQRLQEQAIRRLDNLISEMAKRQSSKSSKPRPQDAGSQKQSPQSQQAQANQTGQTPAQQAQTRGQVKNPQPGDQPLKEQFSEWGNLPPRLRDQLFQGRDERYSDLYRQLTQRYYQRLAEESK